MYDVLYIIYIYIYKVGNPDLETRQQLILRFMKGIDYDLSGGQGQDQVVEQTSHQVRYIKCFAIVEKIVHCVYD